MPKAKATKKTENTTGVVTFRAPPEFFEAIDRFRREHPECPSRSSAVRVLCLTALGTPALKTMAAEVFSEWSGVERHFFRRLFTDFKANFRGIMSSVLAERGWDEEVVEELLGQAEHADAAE
jgi:hypothetical protein